MEDRGKIMIITVDTETKLKEIRFEDDYDSLAFDLSAITRHDKLIHIVFEDEFVYQSLYIEKDKRTKWYKMRIVQIDMVHDICDRNREYINMSFDSIQEFKDKIKKIWNNK